VLEVAINVLSRYNLATDPLKVASKSCQPELKLEY